MSDELARGEAPVEGSGPGGPSLPGSGSNRRTVVWIGLAVAFSLFGDMGIYAILPVYYHQLGLTALQVGIILSANRWIRVITNHVARNLLARFSPPLLLSIALFLGSVLCLLYSTRPSFVPFLTVRVVWGLCWSFIRHTGVMTSIGGMSERAVGRVFGLYQGLVQVGFIAGTFLGGLFFDLAGYRLTFVMLAAASLAAVPMGMAGFGPLGGRRAPPLAREPIGRGSGALLLVRSFIVSCVGTGLIMSTLGHTLEFQIGEDVAIGPIVIGIATINGLLLSLRYVINSLGSPVIGSVLDRIGRLRGETMFAAGSALVLLAAGLFARPLLVVPAVLLFFVLSTGVRIAVESTAGLRGPRAYSRTATAIDIGAAVGPVLGWVGIQYVDRPAVTFLCGGLMFSVGALASFASLRRDESGSGTATALSE